MIKTFIIIQNYLIIGVLDRNGLLWIKAFNLFNRTKTLLFPNICCIVFALITVKTGPMYIFPAVLGLRDHKKIISVCPLWLTPFYFTQVNCLPCLVGLTPSLPRCVEVNLYYEEIMYLCCVSFYVFRVITYGLSLSLMANLMLHLMQKLF